MYSCGKHQSSFVASFSPKKLIVDEVRLFYLTKLAAIEPHDSKMTYIPIFLKEQLEMNKNQIMSIT